jgi:ATP-dependent Lhr-like helicase
VERLRAGRSNQAGATIVLAAVDPAQPYGATLPWPRREGQARRPSRVAGAYVVFVDANPLLYLERGGRGIVTLTTQSNPLRESPGGPATSSPEGHPAPGALAGRDVARGPQAEGETAPLRAAFGVLADAVRAGAVDAVALERVDGEPAVGSTLEPLLVELGFRQGPRKLTLRA